MIEPDPLLPPHVLTFTGVSRWVPRLLPTLIMSTGSMYMGEQGRVSHEEVSEEEELPCDSNSSTMPYLLLRLAFSTSASTLLSQDS